MIAAEVEHQVIEATRTAYQGLTDLGDRVDDGVELEIINDNRIAGARKKMWEAIEIMKIEKEVLAP